MKFQHRFVDIIPDTFEEGILYISLDYGTVMHKCPCGCGNEVNTPLTPTDWKMIYNGETVSLKPSVGNWSFDCKSHYWITNNVVDWALKWSDKTIRNMRNIEDFERQEYYRNKNSESSADINTGVEITSVRNSKNRSWFQKFIFWK